MRCDISELLVSLIHALHIAVHLLNRSLQIVADWKTKSNNLNKVRAKTHLACKGAHFLWMRAATLALQAAMHSLSLHSGNLAARQPSKVSPCNNSACYISAARLCAHPPNVYPCIRNIIFCAH